MSQLVPLYDKKYTCAICDHSFTTKKVRSRFVKVLRFDSDFAPLYADGFENPNFYYVNVCPNCGYSFTEDFSAYFPPGAKQIIQEKISSNWNPRDYGNERTLQEAMGTFKLAAYCSTLKKEKHIVTAGLYIRLAWLYRSMDEHDQETRFLKLALKEYTQSYSTGDYKGTQVSELRLIYLLGELSRKTGLSQDAVRFFSKVIEKQKQSVEPQIIQLAKDRWHEIREEQKLVQG
ncbi:DUF2225 domain-containing protein [Mesobacillus subterraneus]|uniref:DUF2225 domain-containing protein n=2 Tax=Mesobacillus subterraneus TaxID=285983 RepID=A0A3R9FJ50_9BACI|nr:DUF2225 domain-containing protein [Mesobacillus subterraneus]RSD27574.1 DUF2225 domain-containing protein [Mesobacillus subterraneus]